MSDGVFYWVMQVLRGSVIAHGPFRTKQGRDNMMERVRGGEVYPFDCFTDNPEEAISQFNAKGV